MAPPRVLYFCLTLSVLLSLAACSPGEQVDRVSFRTGKRHGKTLPRLVGGAATVAGKALAAMQAHHYIDDDILGGFTLKSLPRETKVFAQEKGVQGQLTAIVDALAQYDSLLKAARYDEITLGQRHIADKVYRARAAGQAVLSRLRHTAKQDMHCDDISVPDDQTTPPLAVPSSQNRQLRAALAMHKYRGFLRMLQDYVTGLCMTSCGWCG